MAGLEDNSKQSDPGEDLQPQAQNHEIIVTNCAPLTKEVDEPLSQVTRERPAVSRFGRLSAYTRGSASTGTVSHHSTRSCPAAVETPGREKLLNKRPSSEHYSWGVTPKDEATRKETEKTMFSALSEEAKAAMLEMRKEMEECRRQLDDDTTITQPPADNPRQEDDTGVDLADEEDEQFEQDSDKSTPNDNAEVVDYISDYSEDSDSLQEAIFRDEEHRRPVSRLSYTHSAPKQKTVPMLPPIQTKAKVQRQKSYPGEIRHLNKSYPGSRPSPTEDMVSNQTYVPGVGRFQVLRPAIARERSFKVTGPGYDSRFHDQVWRTEAENGDIVPREVKKMATQKCKEWLRRWVVSTPPADTRKSLSDTMD
ncbi:uncharacterized protein LOC144928499 [Branchiostoma floridae x Branchiostoma belcheri]